MPLCRIQRWPVGPDCRNYDTTLLKPALHRLFVEDWFPASTFSPPSRLDNLSLQLNRAALKISLPIVSELLNTVIISRVSASASGYSKLHAPTTKASAMASKLST